MNGQTISHYKITGRLGEGGRGVVYRAEDTKLKRPVALKFIAANLINDANARKRFERGATAATVPATSRSQTWRGASPIDG